MGLKVKLQPGWRCLSWLFLGLLFGFILGRGLDNRQHVGRQIILSTELLASLAHNQTQQLGRKPSDAEQAAAIEAYINDEVLYREALRRGLDKGDPVIRRRLLQSMQFVLQAEFLTPQPSEDELASFAASHPLPGQGPRYSFRHVFFGNTRGNTASSRQRAFAQTATSQSGDPFLYGSAVSDKTADQVAAIFGSDFAAALTTLSLGQWSQPLSSAYGWHRVFLQNIQQISWQERRLDYLVAWQRQWLDQAMARRLAELRQSYSIVRH